MKERKVKFWEGRQPPPEYYAPADPYQGAFIFNLDVRAIAQYAKSVGKQVSELTHEEVEPFIIPRK